MRAPAHMHTCRHAHKHTHARTHEFKAQAHSSYSPSTLHFAALPSPTPSSPFSHDRACSRE